MIDRRALGDLAKAVRGLEGAGTKGAIIEAGTALGGSAVILGLAKRADRPMYLYDTFGMIPPPSKQDGSDAHDRYHLIASGEASGPNGSPYYGYRPDLIAEVGSVLASFGLDVGSDNILLVPGLYADTLTINYPVALAHIDCDWYESVLTCLESVEPWLVPGGRFVIDDYWAWSGCRRAVDEFFRSRAGYRFLPRARLHITKD